ncbi:MAG TPA: extracellular solute-binding protein [Actinoplanes sp.]|jgi:putative aldouronate transport system substrate-binding protein
MTPPLSGRPTDRRTFLSLLGAGAAATVGGGLLGGCSEAKSRTQGSVEQKDKLSGLLPTYKGFTGAPPPDIAGVDGAPPGYLKYPSQLVRAFPTVRGKGSTFTVMSPLWGAPPASNNAYYKAIAARTGTTMKWNVQDGNTYLDKMTAILGANDVPDVLVAGGWMFDATPRMSEAMANLFADLTPMLAGDISGRWPMLANISTDAWKLGVWGGQLKAIPFVTAPFSNYFLYRKDIFDTLGLAPPKNADEFLALAKQLTDPSKNRWAFADLWQRGGGGIAHMFRVPGRRGWIKDPSGKMISALETPEYEAAVAYSRKLFDSKVMHPDAANQSLDTKQLFDSGRIAITSDGVGGSLTEAYARQLKTNPSFRAQPLPPLAHDGGTPVVRGSDPGAFFTVINKKLPKEKIEEYLDVADWCSSPFGTEEAMLLQYGVEGTHYKRDAQGTPAYTEQGQRDASLPTYWFLGGRPPAVTESQYPDFVQSQTTWYNTAIKFLDKDMFAGIRIEEPATLQQANQPVNDKVTDIIFGRRPVSDLAQIRKEWAANGGDAGRAFYEKIVKDNNL